MDPFPAVQFGLEYNFDPRTSVPICLALDGPYVSRLCVCGSNTVASSRAEEARKASVCVNVCMVSQASNKGGLEPSLHGTQPYQSKRHFGR